MKIVSDAVVCGAELKVLQTNSFRSGAERLIAPDSFI